jgi:Uncharacterized protein conserved in bacteria (DUF2188)
MKVMPQNQHVISKLNGSWSVRKAGAERASRVFAARDTAITYAREAAKRAGANVYVHSRDGTVLSRESFAANSYPAKG